MDKRILATLGELSRLLYGGNYEVAFRAESTPAIRGASAREHLQAIFGRAGNPDTQISVSGAIALEQIESCIRHRGDHGYGPMRGVFRTRRFKQAWAHIQTHLEHLRAESTSVVNFSLTSVHPIEPVWWEFSYLFVTPLRAEAFIGAASD